MCGEEREEMFYHISKREAMDASFTKHGGENLEDVVSIKEVPASAVSQYGCQQK